MTPRFRAICWLIVVSCVVNACEDSGIEPGNVSFSQQVQPILTDRCAFGGTAAPSAVATPPPPPRPARVWPRA